MIARDVGVPRLGQYQDWIQASKQPAPEISMHSSFISWNLHTGANREHRVHVWTQDPVQAKTGRHRDEQQDQRHHLAKRAREAMTPQGPLSNNHSAQAAQTSDGDPARGAEPVPCLRDSDDDRSRSHSFRNGGIGRMSDRNHNG